MMQGITTGAFDKEIDNRVPHVGISDLEFTYDDAGKPVLGVLYASTDNGFGNPSNSIDYPPNIQTLSIQKKPFTVPTWRIDI